jgi:hypothetical protein
VQHVRQLRILVAMMIPPVNLGEGSLDSGIGLDQPRELL